MLHLKREVLNITNYKEAYASAFQDLNIEWLESYFYVEDYDREVLSRPRKHIIDAGGHIFFAIENDLVLGTVALLKRDHGAFELTKMAVLPNQRGKKIGQRLMQHCIDFAKQEQFQRLFLYSHTKLENAIYIYRKYGFEEVALEQPNPYKRSDIKMEYPLK